MAGTGSLNASGAAALSTRQPAPPSSPRGTDRDVAFGRRFVGGRPRLLSSLRPGRRCACTRSRQRLRASRRRREKSRAVEARAVACSACCFARRSAALARLRRLACARCERRTASQRRRLRAPHRRIAAKPFAYCAAMADDVLKGLTKRRLLVRRGAGDPTLRELRCALRAALRCAALCALVSISFPRARPARDRPRAAAPRAPGCAPCDPLAANPLAACRRRCCTASRLSTTSGASWWWTTSPSRSSPQPASCRT